MPINKLNTFLLFKIVFILNLHEQKGSLFLKIGFGLKLSLKNEIKITYFKIM